MSIVVIGVNHRTGPIDLLERVAVGRDGLGKVIADLVQRYVGALVAERFDEHELHPQSGVRGHQRLGHDRALRRRLRTATGGEAEGAHHGTGQPRSNNSRMAAALRSNWGVPASSFRRSDA